MTSRDEARRLAERRERAEGVAPPGLAAEQERTGQRREALAALAATLATLHEVVACTACAARNDTQGFSCNNVSVQSRRSVVGVRFPSGNEGVGTIMRFEARP